MVLRPRSAPPCVLVAAALLSGASIVPATAWGAPLPAPTWDHSEPVVVKEIVTARELVVAREDGALLRVRVPGVTVPEGTVDGTAVCGAEAARAALAAIAPVGSTAALNPGYRSRTQSWPPLSASPVPEFDESDPAYAADGALYGDLSVDPQLESTTTVLEKMVAKGWMRPGVLLSTALADPSEIGVGNVLASGEGYARLAERAQRGAYAACGGDFRAAAPVAAVATRWGVTRDGWVKTIGGVSVHDDRTKRVRRRGRSVEKTIFGRPGFDRFVAAWGPGQVSLVPGGCEVRWPARGLTIVSEIKQKRRTLSELAPPRDEAGCLALRIDGWLGHGPASQLGALPMKASFARLRKAVTLGPRSRSDRTVVYTGPDDDTTSFVGQLRIGLDRRGRLAELSLPLSLTGSSRLDRLL